MHQPRKRFGQNFLQDESVIQRIVASLAPRPDDNVIEIGPGLGALTKPLLSLLPSLTAIEIDTSLYPHLEKLAHDKTLRLVKQDALQVDFSNFGSDLRLIGNLPYLFAELWGFVTPGLYPNERKYVRRYVGLGFLLATLGAAFAFWLVLPWLFYFFQHYLPQGIQYMPDITSAFDFILYFMGMFMLVFQIPLLCFIMIKSGLCTRAQLLQFRPYVIVSAFILGMLFTPPDVVSQIILALPLWGLYELGLLLSHPVFLGAGTK